MHLIPKKYGAKLQTRSHTSSMYYFARVRQARKPLNMNLTYLLTYSYGWIGRSGSVLTYFEVIIFIYMCTFIYLNKVSCYAISNKTIQDTYADRCLHQIFEVDNL